ncbi:MAG: S-methyl-5-thioribose-1-phosphate isomerase [Desulfamplus sp.]|nr:S-methyl-5-thioribose-1-phosphate isomerase [Desulfamplus sp.]
MKVDGKDMRPIWFDSVSQTVKVIDQRMLPHKLVVAELRTVDNVIDAIKRMFVRGAPLIGVTGAFGVYNAIVELCQKQKRSRQHKNASDACSKKISAAVSDKDRAYDKACDDYLKRECQRLKDARPTAVNLAWGVNRVLEVALRYEQYDKKLMAVLQEACQIVEEEAENCRLIGEHGLRLIEEISRRKEGKPVNILTHCNAGWLATVEYGTATAPMYTAFDRGVDIHVWVDETRPLNQGARLTAWELGRHGIKHTVITDNAGGHLMQHGMVDIVIVGTDRTTRTGDVANKIGTYLKALAANDNSVPFYVALPSSTFDWSLKDGVKDIPIEERDPDEIRHVQGIDAQGNLISVLVPPQQSGAANHAFDVTPSRLVTGFITERGICEASEESILSLFPEHAGNIG